MNIRILTFIALVTATSAFAQRLIFIGPNPTNLVTSALPTGSGAPDSAYQFRYASNLAVGDSVMNFSNAGATALSSCPASDYFYPCVAPPVSNANICLNVYTYSVDEQLVSCCSCPVTPNGLVSLSVRNDLVSNTLTPAIPTSVVVKVLASGGGTCNASVVPAESLRQGLGAWGTTIHALPTSPVTYGLTETAFTNPVLTAAELARMTQLCGFIQANGSGFGICRSCRLGGLGAGNR